MGEPEGATNEQLMAFFLSLMSPHGKIEGDELVRTGMHRLVLQQYFDAIRPELKNLTGWTALKEFKYEPQWRESSVGDWHRGEELTQKWLDYLEQAGLADEQAIQIYDGEQLPMPAPNYRLFVLRDKRLLYYAGGFHAGWSRERSGVGDPLTVMEAIGDGRTRVSSTPDLTFVIIMEALNKVLANAITQRERLVRQQKQLYARLTELRQRIQ